MNHRFLSLFVALIATTALWASNVITYEASSQLSGYNASLNVGKSTFGPAITSHTFSNGTGMITCSGDITKIGEAAFYLCTGLTSITIPNSVTAIGKSAFYSCRGLTSVTIPNSVITIGNGAFEGCNNLTSITIPNSVKMIERCTFFGCSGLTSITIPNSVTTIEWGAFLFCSGLTSITIPNSVTSIGDAAFHNCSGLTYITSYATTPPTCGLYCFSGVDKSIPLCVLANSRNAYKQTNEWREFINICPISATKQK